MRSGILCTDLQPHCVPFKGLWNGSIDAGRIMQNLRQFATYRRTCGVLYRIGSETEDRQGGARPPRASNFKFIYREN